MVFEFVVSVFIATAIVVVVCRYFMQSCCVKTDVKHQHFLVTGGSSGIGLAFALEAVKRGDSVTILARNKDRLNEAKQKLELSKVNSTQVISAFEADVTSDSEILRNVVEKAINIAGPITFLINCAGTSVCYRFEETPHSEFQRMINTNFMGSVNITQIVVPLMKEMKSGNIIFVSSLAGLVGLYGYTAYSASKFALVGMAEALQMEVRPYNIKVTISFPPDTDTQGYAEEMKSKLEETQLISESGGLFSPKDVAIKGLNDAMKGRFMSTLGMDGWLVSVLCCGMSPATSLLDLITQVLMMGFCRIFAYSYLRKCDKTIKQCIEKRIQENR